MFKNLQELITSLPDEASCRKYLELQRWDGKPVCPYCGHDRVYKLADMKTYRGMYKCASKACYKKFSVTMGTIFENSNIPLNKWFIAVYLNTAHKKGISSCQLGRDLGVTQKTAWFMLHRIREGVRAKQHKPLMNAVQVDEVYMGGHEGNMHAKKKSKSLKEASQRKTAVFGMLETGGNVIIQTTNWVTKTNAQKLLTEHIDKDATLVTDAFPMYKLIGKEFKNYVAINHMQGEFVINGFHTNGIENFWSMLKRSVYGIYHQVSPKHLQRYCDEMAYRFNTRKIKDSDRFILFLKNSSGRLTYKHLVENSLTSGTYGKDIETIKTED